MPTVAKVSETFGNYEERFQVERGNNPKKKLNNYGKIIYGTEANEKKKWLNLSHFDDPISKSKYSLSNEEIVSPFPYQLNLTKIMKEFNCKVQWNMWKNCALSKNDFDLLYSKMMKYRIWPVEIFCETRRSVLRKTPKLNGQDSKKSKSVVNIAPPGRFIAFLNISSLLYPGVRKARIAGHLHSYSENEFVKKFSADFFSFPSNLPVGESVNKSKTAADKPKNSSSEIEEKKEVEGTPLLNESGLPAFIVVEFELLKPFIPKKKLESLEEQLKTFVTLKEKIDKTCTSYEIAKNNFTFSIENIITVMTQEYENFGEQQKALTNDPANLFNDLKNFYEYLRTQECFTKITTSLENDMLVFVNTKFGKLCGSNENLPEIYADLVEEMYKVTNNKVGCLNLENSHHKTKNLQLYVEEAIEENELDLAQEYLLLKIATDKANPNYWLDYGLFCFKVKDLDTALEATKEALNLDMNHQMGLLIYGIITATLRDITAAELAFQILIEKYPDFIEAWSVLQLVYTSAGNLEAADVAMQTSLKLDYKKKNNDNPSVDQKKSEDNPFLSYQFNNSDKCSVETEFGIAGFVEGINWAESLSWTTALCPKSKISYRAAILLLKLGFLEYASMELSQELLMPEGNLMCPYFQYYFAVIYYLEGFYEEAICHLELAVKEHGKNCFLWCLMGHCYYKLNNFANAIECYEFVLEFSNRPDDIHLVYLRMGNYYLKSKKFQCAKKIFANACKYSPTPRVWKGVGIACLRLGDLEEAELAFSEANYLDDRDAETWAYLALVNGLMGKKEILRTCFLETKKRKLMNPSLENEIMSMINSTFTENL